MSTRSILFIAHTRIGDAVLATSILRHILSTNPEAKVTIITSPLAAPLFEGYPQLARIIAITKRTYNRHWFTLWRATFSTHWDAIWDMRNSILSYVLCAKFRHIIRNPSNIGPKVKQYEEILRTGPLPYPILWPRAEDKVSASTLLPDGPHYLILAPIANWASKEWPIENFIALAQLLLTGVCAGYRPVVICAAHERKKALPLLTALAEFSPVDLTKGEAHLLTIYACMQRAHGFVGNDSGLMHMAAAAAIPTLGLFGPTPHEVYQPWGENASFVRAQDGNLTLLSPAIVAKKFQALMNL